MLQHVDTLPSRIFGVVLQIGQNVDEDWPFTIVDHLGEKLTFVMDL